MNLLQALALDLGTHAAALALFAAAVCYRANPRRALNRAVTALLLTMSLWQLFVALARTTGDVALWGGLCTPMGSVMVIELFVIHDACVDPRARLRTRLRRMNPAWLTAIAFLIGAWLTRLHHDAPALYPFAFRAVALVALGIGLFELRRRYVGARGVNPHEILLFRVTLVGVTAMMAVFMLIRTPLGSRLNSLIVLVHMCVFIGLMLSERVFDVAGTAKVAARYVLRMIFYVAATVPLLHADHLFFPNVKGGLWIVALLVGVLSYPISLLSDRVTRRLLHALESKAEPAARETALTILRSAENEPALTRQISHVAKEYLGGLDVDIVAEEESLGFSQSAQPRSVLTGSTRKRWLTPATAVRELKGDDLDRALDAFQAARLGAVVRHVGRKVTVTLFVSERSGGTRSITQPELEFLHELATIAGTGLDRLRAISDSFRAQGLAMVGRLAADFSHSARNQISAIQALVEAVKDGQEAELSPEYREAVYQETLALAASHNMALEITRLRPERIDVKQVEVSSLIQSVVTTYRRTAERASGAVDLAVTQPGLLALADEKLVRQVVLNLIRNAVQACAAAGVPPVVSIRVWPDDEVVHVDVIDNGPGVPVEVYDRLFTPWATTKPDGTGLGLSFCLEAMRAVGGHVRYMTPRGLKHAWFRVDLPRVAAASVPLAHAAAE